MQCVHTTANIKHWLTDTDMDKARSKNRMDEMRNGMTAKKMGLSDSESGKESGEGEDYRNKRV